MAIGQLKMQKSTSYTVRFHNCTNCDQLHVKICPAFNYR